MKHRNIGLLTQKNNSNFIEKRVMDLKKHLKRVLKIKKNKIVLVLSNH